VDHLASINPIFEKVVKRTAVERATAEHPAGRERALLAPDVAPVEIGP
jgi:hypothetical protein